MKKLNFLPNQYLKDSNMRTKHNYLSEQFSDYKKIFYKIEKIVKQNDFTLGTEVDVFEKNISNLLNAKYVVSVGSGTDALMLSSWCYSWFRSYYNLFMQLLGQLLPWEQNNIC